MEDDAEDVNVHVYDEERHGDMLVAFMAECQRLGIVNNASRAMLKIDHPEVRFWVTIDSGAIVSMSGVQMLHLPELDGCWRLQYRTATLPDTRVAKTGRGLTKRLANSWEWREVLPHQIAFARDRGAKRLLVTTNSSTNAADPSGHMFRVDRVMRVLERQGDVDLIFTDYKLFNTYQNVWQITPSFERECLGKLPCAKS